MLKKTITLLIFIVLNYLAFYVTVEYFYRFSWDMKYRQATALIYLRVMILIALMVNTGFLFFLFVIRNRKRHKVLSGFYISVSMFLIIFYGTEICFSVYTKSYSISYSLASLLWYNKYWHPINSNGYRDTEMNIQHKRNGKIIFFIGDSFTAGAGIENVNDRFSNLFSKQRQSYSVYNCGVSGANTKQEMNVLLELPIKPAVVVWQYFFNDIEGSRAKYKANYVFNAMDDVTGVFKSVVKYSFTFNYIYFLFPHKDVDAYADMLKRSIENPMIVKDHKNDMGINAAYCDKSDIRLIVVLFPYFNRNGNNEFNAFTDSVKEYLWSRNVETVDVNNLTKDLCLADKVVNNTDAHASVKVNKIVADELLRLIR